MRTHQEEKSKREGYREKWRVNAPRGEMPGAARPDARRGAGNAGFSLIEVLLSVTILALISIPLLNYFTESMVYSSRMGRQQKATILAQEITEGMKAETPLIQKVTDPASGERYGVPYLEDHSSGLTMASSDATFETDGIGGAVFEGTRGQFDVVVNLSTSLESGTNDLERDYLYGIDDSTDVLAVEQNQMQDAVAYFMAVNAAYCTRDELMPDGTIYHHNDPRMTKEEVIANMTRDMKVEVGNDGSLYTVRVYYEYTCKGLEGDPDEEKSRNSTNLVSVTRAKLSKIYLLYDWMDGEDNLTMTASALPPATDGPLELFLVYQNRVPGDMSSAPTESDELLVDIPPGVAVHTNVGETLPEEAGTRMGTIAGKIKDKASGSPLSTAQPITGVSTPVRLVSIKTEVFVKNHGADDEPLAAVETTKGE